MRSISVVIPSYNGRKLLESYLPSLYTALNACRTNREVIVVDDASTDDTANFIRTNYPDIKLIVQQINGGFATTINRGIQAATCDVVCCLNNDMEVAGNFFEKLIPHFDHDDTFGVMSQIYDITKTKLIESVKRPTWGSPTIKISDDKQATQCTTTLFVCGGNGLYDRKKLQLLGGFSSLYAPCYFEDVDLSVRAWSVGWKSYCDVATRCYHLHSATIKSIYKQLEIVRINYRNNLYFNYLHTPAQDRTAFLKAVERQRILYKIMWWNERRQAKTQSIDEFFSTISKADTADKEFDEMCSRNKLKRSSLQSIISTYFS